MTVYRLRNMAHANWDYFGDPRVGKDGSVVAAQAESVMQTRAAAAPDDLHRVYILSQSDANALFDELGVCDTPDVSGVAQYYFNGETQEAFAFPPGGGAAQSGPAGWWAGFGW